MLTTNEQPQNGVQPAQSLTLALGIAPAPLLRAPARTVPAKSASAKRSPPTALYHLPRDVDNTGPRRSYLLNEPLALLDGVLRAHALFSTAQSAARWLGAQVTIISSVSEPLPALKRHVDGELKCFVPVGMALRLVTAHRALGGITSSN